MTIGFGGARGASMPPVLPLAFGGAPEGLPFWAPGSIICAATGPGAASASPARSAIRPARVMPAWPR